MPQYNHSLSEAHRGGGNSFDQKQQSYDLRDKLLSIRLKSLLHQGLSEPEFHGDLVYKFKKVRGMTDFSDQF